MTLFCATLTDRFLSITGPDAIKFLQGQASCDLNELRETNFTYGTLNTPKGRMYCLFKAIKTADGLLLSMHESLLDTTIEKLSKYAAFFKCDLKADPSYKAIGISCDDELSFDTLVQSRQISTHTSNGCSQEELNYSLHISKTQKLVEIWTQNTISELDFLSDSKAISLDQWLALETASGIPALYATSQEEFILQSLNLQQLGAVSFKKGCYTGQEIIARMKFLGKQKKQAYLIHTSSKCVRDPLAPVYSEDGAKCGTLIRAHWSEKTGSLALCILPISSALSYGKVFLEESLKTPFSVTEIDYSEYKF